MWTCFRHEYSWNTQRWTTIIKLLDVSIIYLYNNYVWLFSDTETPDMIIFMMRNIIEIDIYFIMLGY
jgi:hypothetical protein